MPAFGYLAYPLNNVALFIYFEALEQLSAMRAVGDAGGSSSTTELYGNESIRTRTHPRQICGSGKAYGRPRAE